MGTLTRNWLTAALLGLLVACGGGGGGDRATGVEPGPPPGGGPIDPPPPVIPSPLAPYAEAEELIAHITKVDTDDDVRPMVWFQLTDGHGTAITDLEFSNVRFVIAKLQASPLGNMTGTWQSYVNTIEPWDKWGVTDVGTEDRVQATYENDDSGGTFTNNGDGTYFYHFAIDLRNPPYREEAEAEGLDLSFDAELTHRVAIQFDGNPNTTANPVYDWIPDTGATGGVFNMDIAATANCNSCHDPLGIHGGNRREVQYCVTCHNPGSTDAHTTNTVDMKVMIHKIHMGANLPSVEAGGKYNIIGYRGSDHDYSGLHYPQDIRNCVNCHAGSRTGAGRDDLVLTSQGDNWTEYPSSAACGSCHDDAFDRHINKFEDTECAGCHSAAGYAGSIEDSHRMLIQEKREEFLATIESVTNSSPGESPMVTFKIVNPKDGNTPYDIKNDPIFQPFGIRIGNAWSTSDYTNQGTWGAEGDAPANQVQSDAVLASTDNGDGSYTVTMPPIPADASGSGIASIEGHPTVEMVLDKDIGPEEVDIPLGDAHLFFSIDEVDGTAESRRPGPEGQADTLDNCLSCHQTLVLHGGNRTDNLDTCVSCHNPRNTDRHRRELDEPWCDAPPTDGKAEESVDFKTMIHAIHAAGMRENPLQVVGYQCYTTHVYDTDQVHYPGDLSNCTACHSGDSYTLPLADSVLGTTVDSVDIADPADDLVITPATAVCSSCHDDKVAISHMESNGGNLATTQAAIDSGEVVEECSICHKSGASADVSTVHNPH